MTADPFDLARFVAAQAGAWETARAELAAGRKRSHWMWFVFPQCAGLGASAMSVRYAIASRAEARAYLDHALLGARLREATALAMRHAAAPAAAILGRPDDAKFHACMTLFAAVAPEEPAFRDALSAFFAGAPHPGTAAWLARG